MSFLVGLNSRGLASFAKPVEVQKSGIDDGGRKYDHCGAALIVLSLRLDTVETLHFTRKFNHLAPFVECRLREGH